MAATVEDLSIPTYSTDALPDSDAELIRFVSPHESLRAALARSIAAGQRFLDITRAGQASTAIKLQNSILENPIEFDIAGNTFRSSLVAQSQSEVRTAEVGRFTTITIRVGTAADDIVKVNTIQSSIIGSVLIYNLGPYGNTTKVTAVINVLREILQGTADRLATQKALFLLIEARVKVGQTINQEDLFILNPTFRGLAADELNARLQRLRALIYLITNYEITRRPRFADSVGYKQTAAEASDPTVLCAEMILDVWTKVFRLLQTATLTIEQVFAQDAPYGLPTAKALRKKPEAALINKIRAINTLYMQTFYPSAVLAAASIGKEAIPSMEEAHQRLSKATTIIEESPGKTYITPKAPSKRKQYGGLSSKADSVAKIQLNFDNIQVGDSLEAIQVNEELNAKNTREKVNKRNRVLTSSDANGASLLWQARIIEQTRPTRIACTTAEPVQLIEPSSSSSKRLRRGSMLSMQL